MEIINDEKYNEILLCGQDFDVCIDEDDMFFYMFKKSDGFYIRYIIEK